jgi:hypothetical protein
MRTIKLNKTYNVPENWDDLSLPQQEIAATKLVPAIPKFWMQNEDGKYEIVSHELASQMRLLALQLVLGMNPEEFYEMNAEDAHFLINEEKVTDFIFNQRGPLVLKNTKHRGLVGPSDKLNGISAIEWFTASRFYDFFKQTEDPKFLLPFLACFFRPLKEGARAKFDIRTVEQREKIVAKMPTSQQVLTCLWYESNRDRLAKNHEDAFKEAGGEGDFLEMLLQLAKDGPFGTMEQTQHTEVDMVMTEINRVSRENRELKEKYKS